MNRKAAGIARMKACPNAERFNHGDRNRYLAGCRCEDCRAGNAAYARERRAAVAAGEGNGYVPAWRARRHLRALQRRGIGRDAVHAASDVALSTICEVRDGKQANIRLSTERKLLAVGTGQACDRALVPAKRTWKRIAELVEEGYTKSRIAKELGYVGKGICLAKDRVTVRNAHRVERLFRRLTA